jgi:hypothetical protein
MTDLTTVSDEELKTEIENRKIANEQSKISSHINDICEASLSGHIGVIECGFRYRSHRGIVAEKATKFWLVDTNIVRENQRD